jgi:hypothetical protein
MGITMEQYKNLGRDSGVSFFEIKSESITVQFNTGKTYLYTYQSAGSHNIEEMKLLAQNGEGLNSFINRVVRKKYASILRQQ